MAYSGINSGAAQPPSQSGADWQKSMEPPDPNPPKVAHTSKEESMPVSRMNSPSLGDLVKAAMAGAAGRIDIQGEAARQMAHLGEVPSPDGGEKVSSEYVEKLACAVEQVHHTFVKSGADGLGTTSNQPGSGPGSIGVLEATSEKNEFEAGQSGQATPTNQPPKDPGTEKTDPATPTTALETNVDMQHPAQSVDPINKGASALAKSNFSRVAKLAGFTPDAPVTSIRKAAASLKRAEDATSPSSISAGKDPTGHTAEPPVGASPSEEKVPAQPPDVSKQEKMVGSNQSAIDYTKGQAKADPKSDLGNILDEPALTSSTDKTLQQAFDTTEQAGVKISSDQTYRSSAARALLSKLAEEAKAEAEAKKEKEKGKEKTQQFSAPGVNPGNTAGMP